MEKYPMNLTEFEKEFSTEQQCREYLLKLRYENGVYICPKCGSIKSWLVNKTVYECCDCGHQSSVIAGTIFQDTHKPLTLWFRAIWYVTSQKNGTSALGLQRILGLGSYRTAWTWLHKLRRAMVRPGRDKLHGLVEVDEAYIGAPGKGGKRGRGADNKVLVVIAVEINDNTIGRIRMGIIDSASSENLHDFIETTVEKGSTIITDGWRGYNGLSGKGYLQKTKQHKNNDGETLLPHVHTVISLLKRWLLGTLQGSFSKEHIAYYLDEYTFRFNRRKSKSRGMLFYRLLQNAVQLTPITYDDIVGK
jgi:transposase-like protein/DNA-directed RNA polymerase subunit RPC12/RpoP